MGKGHHYRSIDDAVHHSRPADFPEQLEVSRLPQVGAPATPTSPPPLFLPTAVSGSNIATTLSEFQLPLQLSITVKAFARLPTPMGLEIRYVSLPPRA
jgi:hypothetical protein